MEHTDFLLPTRIVRRALAQAHARTGLLKQRVFASDIMPERALELVRQTHENESCQMVSVSLNFDPKKYFSFYIADFPPKLFTKKIYNIIV